MTEVHFYTENRFNKHVSCYFDISSPLTLYFQSYVNKKIFEINENKFIFNYALISVIINYANSINEMLDLSEIFSYYSNPQSNFDLSDQAFLRDNQYKIIKENITTNFRGIVQAQTGFGKGEVIVYLASHYIGKGNKLVLTNNNQVANELKDRFKKYGVKLKENKILVINPTSFMVSNKVKEQDYIDYFQNVDLILIDEFESFTKSIYELMKLVPNYKYAYTFSASPEKVRGKNLSDTSLLNLNYDAIKVLKFAGMSVFYSESIKPVEINVIKADLVPQHFPAWMNKSDSQGAVVMKQKFSQGNLFNNKIIFKVLNKIVLPNKKSILFIPYRFIEHGDKLFDYYKNTKYKVIQWDGKKIRSNIPGKEKLTQKDIKELSASNSFDILLASKVADRGIDLRFMNDIFMFIHSQYNNVIQVIGRCSRESLTSTTYIWMIENNLKNTDFYNTIQAARLKRIRTSFKNELREWDLKDFKKFNPNIQNNKRKEEVKKIEPKIIESKDEISTPEVLGGFYIG